MAKMEKVISYTMDVMAFTVVYSQRKQFETSMPWQHRKPAHKQNVSLVGKSFLVQCWY